MPGEGAEKRQNALTHEGAEPDAERDEDGIADERATVLQPDGKPVADTSKRVEGKAPKGD